MSRTEEASSSPAVKAKKLLSMGEEEISDEDRNPRHRRASWRDVVGQNLPEEPHARVSGSPRGWVQGPAPTKPSTQRLFSKEEVIEIFRESNLRGPGWTKVVSKASMKKATSQAREMLGISKKKRKLSCWKCKGIDHINADCPLGETCIYCHQPGHRIAECPRNHPKNHRDKGKQLAISEQEKEDSDRERTHMVFIPLTEEIIKAKEVIQKMVGILISGRTAKL